MLPLQRIPEYALLHMEGLIIQQVKRYTIVEFQSEALMDPQKLDAIAADLYRLIDLEDRRWIVLDFAKVAYVSSQFIGILMNMHKKVAQRPHSKLIVCSLGKRLTELLRITSLDKILTIRTTQDVATAEV